MTTQLALPFSIVHVFQIGIERVIFNA